MALSMRQTLTLTVLVFTVAAAMGCARETQSEKEKSVQEYNTLAAEYVALGMPDTSWSKEKLEKMNQILSRLEALHTQLSMYPDALKNKEEDARNLQNGRTALTEAQVYKELGVDPTKISPEKSELALKDKLEQEEKSKSSVLSDKTMFLFDSITFDDESKKLFENGPKEDWSQEQLKTYLAQLEQLDKKRSALLADFAKSKQAYITYGHAQDFEAHKNKSDDLRRQAQALLK